MTVRETLERAATWRTAAKIVAAGSLLVYAADCKHVYDVMQEHAEESERPVDPKDVEQLERYYREETSHVDKKEHEEKVVEAVATADEYRDEGVLMIGRESAVFAAGGYATMMQLAHPFVAQGINEHSNLKNGVQERFFKTFKYMFAMQFGKPEDAGRAARVVRKLHNGVRGEIQEDVGLFERGYRYDAAHTHSLVWVSLTLAEGALYSYELFVRRLTSAEKDVFVAGFSRFTGRFFGVPASMLPTTAEELYKMIRTMVQSRALAVGSTARRIDSFLWAPPSPRFWPVMALVRWLSLCKLPPRVAEGFSGWRPGRGDRMRAALVLGYSRFLYRLMPGSFRWLTPYVAMQERLGHKQSATDVFLSRASARIANSGLDLLMPPRDPTKFSK